ncbi:MULTISPECIES: M48 family metallopeptidase [unclassified Methylibium]|jgi:STE24 endopeptidase|uniref:M48 family metallopeptidase n=1 Tax=unclassified Methylibium TaxID=2633235 RepID=UPI0006FAE9AF|nr:M48 family metallopeptidase [Methylibium sp. Root1272]KQW69957.1 peptidase M48 [Methylibium sp. Root1272]
MTTSVLTVLFAAFLVGSLLLRVWLASRQIRHVATHRHSVPAAFEATVSLPAHQRAADYTLAKLRLGLLTTAFGAAVLLGWTLLGGLDALNGWLLAHARPSLGDLGYQLALLAAFALITGLIDLPFEAWTTFRLEQRHGFNHMTPGLWLADQAKGVLVGALLGLPIAALILWLMGAAGSTWWLWAWAVWVGFNLLVLVLYPTVIAPLFNKFQPLEDGALKARVEALMARCGFAAKGLFVMDGSRRSAHANAYFTGFGAAKRVVFFDTLLSKLSPPEVEAVLAHELGHFKHRHVTKRIVAMFALSLAGFALLGWLSQQVWFYAGLGVRPSLDAPNDALALLLFLLVGPVFSFFVTPLFAGLSRRHEFEADAYACAQTSARDLGGALLKLYEDNASTLTPDRLYVRFYYSHPPASERLAAMGALA